jgi:hypothetical protein
MCRKVNEDEMFHTHAHGTSMGWERVTGWTHHWHPLGGPCSSYRQCLVSLPNRWWMHQIDVANLSFHWGTTPPVLPVMVLYGIFWVLKMLNQTGIFASAVSLSLYQGEPWIGERLFVLVLLMPPSGDQSGTCLWSREEVQKKLGAQLCPHCPLAITVPGSFPWAYWAPADPLCWQLVSINSHTSPDLPETLDKHRLLSSLTHYSQAEEELDSI